jgi:potassium channel subfamily K
MAEDKYNNTTGNGRSLSGGLSFIRSEASTFDREDGIRVIGRLKLRGKTDDLPQ